VQELPQQQAGRPRADDRHLRPLGHHCRNLPLWLVA
jgi:hypothetical protein